MLVGFLMPVVQQPFLPDSCSLDSVSEPICSLTMLGTLGRSCRQATAINTARFREKPKGCSVERKITGGQIFEATYGDTSKVGAACTKSSQSGCDVGLTPSGLLPNMQVWVKIGCPKAGTPSYLVYYSIQTNNCGPLGLVSITICVCVCPCWCVLGRQGICIISRNDKRPQTWFI